MSEPLNLVLLSSSAGVARGLLQDLSRHGLLRPVLLVDERDRAELLDRGEVTVIRLDHFLAGQRPSLLRYLNIVYVDGMKTHAVPGAEALRSILFDRCRVAGLRFTCATIAIPHSTGPVDPSVFHPTWDANLIVVPEDSTGSHSMLAMDLDSSRVQHLAAGTLLTLGGVWKWLHEAPLDSFVMRYPEGKPYVSVVRLALRMVDAGDIGHRAVEEALSADGPWPIPVGFVAHGAPEAEVARLVQRSAPKFGFTFVPLPPPPLPKPTPTNILSALRLFFAGMYSALSAMPSRAVRRAKDRVRRSIASAAQRVTFGSDSEIKIYVGKQPLREIDLVGVNAYLAELGSLPDLKPAIPVPQPESWRDLMNLALGLVDGGPMRPSVSDLSCEWQGHPSVFVNRSVIAVEPGEQGTSSFVLEPDDVRLLTGSPVEDIKPVAIPPTDAIAANNIDLRLSELGVPPVTEANTGAESAEGVVGDAEGLEGVNPAVASLAVRFRSWNDRRKKSLLGGLGESLSAAIQASRAALVAAESAIQGLGEEFEAFERQEKRALRRRRWKTLISFLLLGGTITLAIFGFLQWATYLGFIFAGAAVLVLILIGWSMLSDAREQVRLQHRLRELVERPQWLMSARQKAAEELVRLTHLSQQFADWAEIASQIIHRPWGRTPRSAEATPWGGDTGVYSFTVGIAEIDHEELLGQVMRLRREICKPGWLSATLANVRGKWQRRYGVIVGLGLDQQTEPEADLSGPNDVMSGEPGSDDAIYTPRRQFCLDVCAGRHADALRKEQSELLREIFDSSQAERLVDTVRCAVPGLDGLVPSEFLGGLVDFSPLPPVPERFMRVQLTGDRGAITRSVFGVSEVVSHHAVDDDVERRNIEITRIPDRYLLAAFRLDLAEPVDPMETLLVENSGTQEETFALVIPVAVTAPEDEVIG